MVTSSWQKVGKGSRLSTLGSSIQKGPVKGMVFTHTQFNFTTIFWPHSIMMWSRRGAIDDGTGTAILFEYCS